MFNYPIFLNLTNKACLVVGAGPVGCRKALGLLVSGASQVKMVAPSHPSELELNLQKFAAFMRLEREFEEADLNDCALVFAATSNPQLNEHIATLCEQKNCLCNVASSLEKSQFIVPALSKQNQISVAVSTNGISPTLAQEIRNSLANSILPQYQTKVKILAKVRPLILKLGLPSKINKNILETVATAPIDLLLGNKEDLTEYLNLHLPSGLNGECRESILEMLINDC